MTTPEGKSMVVNPVHFAAMALMPSSVTFNNATETTR
jgi:hypothetical protein